MTPNQHLGSYAGYRSHCSFYMDAGECNEPLDSGMVLKQAGPELELELELIQTNILERQCFGLKFAHVRCARAIHKKRWAPCVFALPKRAHRHALWRYWIVGFFCVALPRSTETLACYRYFCRLNTDMEMFSWRKQAPRQHENSRGLRGWTPRWNA